MQNKLGNFCLAVYNLCLKVPVLGFKTSADKFRCMFAAKEAFDMPNKN